MRRETRDGRQETGEGDMRRDTGDGRQETGRQDRTEEMRREKEDRRREKGGRRLETGDGRGFFDVISEKICVFILASEGTKF